MTSVNILLAMPVKLHNEIKKAALASSLKQAEVMRQSIRIGLPLFRDRFSGSVETK